MLTRLTLVTGSLLLMTACTPPPPPAQPGATTWSKPGAVYADFINDRTICTRVALNDPSHSVMYGDSWAPYSVQGVSTDIVTTCLARYGWRQDPAGFGPLPEVGVYLR